MYVSICENVCCSNKHLESRNVNPFRVVPLCWFLDGSVHQDCENLIARRCNCLMRQCYGCNCVIAFISKNNLRRRRRLKGIIIHMWSPDICVAWNTTVRTRIDHTHIQAVHAFTRVVYNDYLKVTIANWAPRCKINAYRIEFDVNASFRMNGAMQGFCSSHDASYVILKLEMKIYANIYV